MHIARILQTLQELVVAVLVYIFLYSQTNYLKYQLIMLSLTHRKQRTLFLHYY